MGLTTTRHFSSSRTNFLNIPKIFLKDHHMFVSLFDCTRKHVWCGLISPVTHFGKDLETPSASENIPRAGEQPQRGRTPRAFAQAKARLTGNWRERGGSALRALLHHCQLPRKLTSASFVFATPPTPQAMLNMIEAVRGKTHDIEYLPWWCQDCIKGGGANR